MLATLGVLVGLWAMHGLAMPAMATGMTSESSTHTTHPMSMSDTPATSPSLGCGMGGHEMCVATPTSRVLLALPVLVAVAAPEALAPHHGPSTTMTATPRAPPDAADPQRLCISRT